MNKEMYLEQLYQELQKYDIDSALKHVTEYDYIISDMEDTEDFEAVIEKLGTGNELAASIAEEFGYELKRTNQFEDSILNKKVNSKEKYSHRNTYAPLAKIIDILFVIGSIIFFLSYFITFAGLLVFILIFSVVSLPTMVWLLLSLVTLTIFVMALYMLVLNFKNMITNRLRFPKSEVL